MRDGRLETTDLMVGDWVMYGKKKRKCYNICGHTNDVMLDNGVLTNVMNLQPIPITPEILKKIGFVANKHVYPYPYYEYINEEDKLKIGFAFPQGDRTSYKEPWVYIDSECVFVEHLPCMFVHELQHALRLCGITLNIEV